MTAGTWNQPMKERLPKFGLVLGPNRRRRGRAGGGGPCHQPWPKHAKAWSETWFSSCLFILRFWLMISEAALRLIKEIILFSTTLNSQASMAGLQPKELKHGKIGQSSKDSQPGTNTAFMPFDEWRWPSWRTSSWHNFPYLVPSFDLLDWNVEIYMFIAFSSWQHPTNEIIT